MIYAPLETWHLYIQQEVTWMSECISNLTSPWAVTFHCGVIMDFNGQKKKGWYLKIGAVELHGTNWKGGKWRRSESSQPWTDCLERKSIRSLAPPVWISHLSLCPRTGFFFFQPAAHCTGTAFTQTVFSEKMAEVSNCTWWDFRWSHGLISRIHLDSHSFFNTAILSLFLSLPMHYC